MTEEKQRELKAVLNSFIASKKVVNSIINEFDDKLVVDWIEKYKDEEVEKEKKFLIDFLTRKANAEHETRIMEWLENQL